VGEARVEGGAPGSLPRPHRASRRFDEHATGSDESANGYLAVRPELAGFAISIPGPIEVGRMDFADLMSDH
jgi:hypothetical protein